MTDIDTSVQDKIDAAIAGHNEAIDDALNGLASDPEVPAYAYVDALFEIANRCTTAADAVLLEQTQNRQWAQFQIDLTKFLDNFDRTDPRHMSRGIEFHQKLRKQAKDGPSGPADAATLERLTNRLLYEVFGIDPNERIKP